MLSFCRVEPRLYCLVSLCNSFRVDLKLKIHERTQRTESAARQLGKESILLARRNLSRVDLDDFFRYRRIRFRLDRKGSYSMEGRIRIVILLYNKV